MKISTLDGVAIKSILNTFNESFSDYFIPIQLTEEQLVSKMKADKVNLDLSVGVFENENLIAVILHGFDVINNEKVIYNGGTGVIPDKRGAGLTRKMYHFILPILKKKGIDKLQLEVISNNIQAIKSYQRSGYTIQRTLLCFNGELNVLNPNENILIKELEQYNWDLMESFWDTTPTWQNSRNVLNELQNSNISLGAYQDSALVGYLIFNPVNYRIQQIAIRKDLRQHKIASRLIHELTKTYGNKISLINADKNCSELIAFFEKLGLKKNIEQVEMTLDLKEFVPSNEVNETVNQSK